VAHAHAGGRWLATGGGGYDAYRVVPRAWALTWLAGAHREVPAATPPAWRERWSAEGTHHGQAPLPETFDDPELDARLAGGRSDPIDARARAFGALVRRVFVPRLVREARDRGWLDSLASGGPTPSTMPGAPGGSRGRPTVLARVTPEVWAGLALQPGVVAPASVSIAHGVIAASLVDGAHVSAAVVGSAVVGLLVSRHADDAARRDVLALGVASHWRRQGIATALLLAHRETTRPGDADELVEVTLAERDVFEPMEPGARAAIAAALLASAGYAIEPAPSEIRAVDPHAIRGVRQWVTP
jgi:GNAT superfamily N-acetyltransferase